MQTPGAMTAFDLSIILAEATDHPELDATLASIEAACAGIAAEVLVVRPGGRAPLRASQAVTLREITVDDATLVPVRWGHGVRAAQAPVFGCLTTEFTVNGEWARALLAAVAGGATGAAGAIELAPHAGMTSTATYLVRFSAYMPRPGREARTTSQMPGDTAGYQRDAVIASADLLADGFWEVEFHRRFLADGRRLVAIAIPLAKFNSSRSLSASLLLRFRHGREFGITRVVRHRHNRAVLVLGAPLVSVVLATRIVRRALRSPGAWRLLLRAFPAVALMSAAWAAGEARGAWSAGRGR